MADETDNVVELNAWQETTGLAARPEPRSNGLQAYTDIAPIADTPESRRRFAGALAPVLTLVAPTGMTDSDRRDWYAAAWRALSHLPADVIETGAKAAMSKVDHPAKIVATIIAATEADMNWRHRMRSSPLAGSDQHVLPAPGQERCTADEAAEIVNKFLKRTKQSEPRRHPAAPTEVKGGSDKPPRTPTREDYLRLGVAPDVIDAHFADLEAAKRSDRDVA